jgi:hypothetical protein
MHLNIGLERMRVLTFPDCNGASTVEAVEGSEI